MKKVIAFLSLLAALISISACSKGEATEAHPAGMDAEIYVMEGTDSPAAPSVILEKNGRFTFTFSAFSSYIARGFYETEEDRVLLQTQDDENRYVFKRRDGALIFMAEESSEIPSFNQISDGAVFR